jgi:hypothetical protein
LRGGEQERAGGGADQHHIAVKDSIRRHEYPVRWPLARAMLAEVRSFPSPRTR